jgi:hypothetical protein
MKRHFLPILLLASLIGCTHPLDIAGQGDIRSSSAKNDCLLEELPCEVVAVGGYNEAYRPEPRSGFQFVGWDNCLSQQGDSCVFDVDAKTVLENWGKVMPPLVAKFAPLCETAPASSFSAVQTVIFDGKGCSSGGCHAGSRPANGMNLSNGNAYNAIVNVTAQAGGGLKRVLPGDASKSFLYRKVAARTNPGSFTIAGSPMPLAGSALSASQLAALALWIDAGAPEFGRANELNEVERLLGLCAP